jgi:hypothetical protein
MLAHRPQWNIVIRIASWSLKTVSIGDLEERENETNRFREIRIWMLLLVIPRFFCIVDHMQLFASQLANTYPASCIGYITCTRYHYETSSVLP